MKNPENPSIIPTERNSQIVNASREFFLDKLVKPGEILPDMPRSASLRKALIMAVAVGLWLAGQIASPVFGALVYEERGYLGLVKAAPSVFYAVLAISIAIVPPFIKNWYYKTGILVGSSGSVLMIIAGGMVTSCPEGIVSPDFWCAESWMYTITIIFCIIFGITAAVLWLSANRYINGCTAVAVKGQIFGYFVCSLFIARIARTIIFTWGPEGNAGSYFVPILLIIIALGAFTMSPKVPKYRDEGYQWAFKNEIQALAEFAISARVRPLLLFFFVVGVQGNYLDTQATIDMITYPYLGHSPGSISAISLIQGVFGMIASIIVGYSVDRVKTKVPLTIFNTISIFGMVISVLTYSLNNFNLCYARAIFMGIGYGGLLCLVFLIMAKDFKGTITCFTVAQFFYSFGTFVGICLSFCSNLTPLITVLFCLLVLNQIAIYFYQSN